MKNYFFRLHVLFCIALLFSSWLLEAKAPKYVFLFIGDGLSFPQRMAAQEFVRTNGRGELLINRFPVQSATTTRAANQFITDSAASGTAIACGEKTVVGRIGMDVTGKRNLESIAAVAQKNGRKTAIITSVTLNHATPSAFYGHRLNRGMYYELGEDLIASGFDYFGGGGIARPTGNDKSRPNIYQLAQKAGYTVCLTPDEVRTFKPGSGKVIAVGSDGALPYALDKKPGDLKLADFVRQGIAHCDNPKGFFMMCEGGAIDWLCHANDAVGTFHEVLEFDDAVKVAWDFYRKHPEDTLIVVTGDHETGGLTLGFAGTKYKSFFEVLAGQKATVFGLGRMLPEKMVWEDAKKFVTANSGLLFNAGKADKKNPALLSAKEAKELEKAFAKQFPKGKLNKKSNVFAQTIVRLVNNKAGLAWSTGAHTALPVNTTAAGKNAEIFNGMIDNTDIAIKLKKMVAPVNR